MPDDSRIDYARLLGRALSGMVRELLMEIERDGFPAGHELLIGFHTGGAGVELPAAILKQYPQQMTIALRPRSYRELVVDPQAFQVSLMFGALEARVRVPFASLLSFQDSRAQVAFQMLPGAGAPESRTDESSGEPPVRPASGQLLSFAPRKPPRK